ncbi:hypothetical protein [Streptomyces sp. NPDC006012]|uniref:hypothetical protein n=1 Tax=Streptomyces sp. NPDC006012 TaxID=3364739 RepID=UPI00369BA931
MRMRTGLTVLALVGAALITTAGTAVADGQDDTDGNGVLNGLLSNSQLTIPTNALSCGGGLIPVLNGASCQTDSGR